MLLAERSRACAAGACRLAGAAAALVLVLLLIMEAAKLEAASKRAEGERQLKVD
jgi:hypothetical protein